MVDPVFEAPPAPPMNETPTQQQVPPVEPAPQVVPPESGNQPQSAEAPQEQSKESSAGKQQVLARLGEVKEHMIRYFWYSIGGLFLLGMFFGCTMSGSKSVPQQAPVQKGLSSKVIQNTDKKGKMPICGVARPTEACLFYVLNHSTQDHVAEDYFEQISKAMDRPLFKIRRDNVTYAKTPIKPAYFAEIIVPGY